MKNELRNKYLNKRKKLSKGMVTLDSQKVFTIITQNFNLENKFVMSYVSHQNELDLNLLNTSISHVYIPYINADDIMRPAMYGALEKDKYHIYVPIIKQFIEKEKLDVCIIPGIVFDNQGNRIGYGKGYYDIFLKQLDVLKIGCCYEWQLTNHISSDSHDIKMDYIVTEKRVIKC